jgi:hypothetical protein
MYLSDDDKRMLNGERGAGVQLAMDLLTKVGEAYGAKRMVDIQGTHAAVVYPHLTAAVDLMERFAKVGGKFCVPTTSGACFRPHNFNRWKEFPDGAELQQNVVRMTNAFESMGALPTYSCTPYLQGYVPRFGQIVSWMESSAIIFANSVLGARTNRTTMGIDVSSAIAGKVPEFGLLLDENRRGNVLVKMEFTPRNLYEYGSCGYLVGKLCSGKIPVIEGMPLHSTPNQLKAFGGAAASQGGIALYHLVNITPEARSREDAFKGTKPEYDLKIGKSEVDRAAGQVGELSTYGGRDFDAVLIGCPHPMVEEIRELAQHLQGRKVKDGIKFCVFASSEVLHWSRRLGYVGIIEAAGGEVFEGDCIVQHPTKAWGWRHVLTNSAKYAIILPSDPTWLDVYYADAQECVRLSTV